MEAIVFIIFQIFLQRVWKKYFTNVLLFTG